MEDQITVKTDYSINIFTLAKKTLIVKMKPSDNTIEITGKIVNQQVFDKFKEKLANEAMKKNEEHSKG